MNPYLMFFQREMTPIRKLLLMHLAAGGKLTEYEVTGNPAVFQTNVAKPLTGFTIPFLPIQQGNGDPSPQNQRPISGWQGLTANRAGVNLFHPVESEMVSEGWNRYFPNPMKKAGKYSISCQNTFGGTGNLGCSIVFVAHPSNSESAIGDSIGGYTFGGETKKVIENVTITEAQANAEYIRFAFLSSGTTYSGIENAQIQIEYGETASPYAEYTGQSYHVTFPAEAGTVYGGRIDLKNGVLGVYWAGISKKWSEWQNATDMGSGITRKQYLMVSNLQTGSANNMCNVAPYGANENAETHFHYTGSSGSATRNCRMFLPSDTDGDTVVTVITKISVPLVYQLTPQEIQTLIGTNVLWTDMNEDMTVQYLKKG